MPATPHGQCAHFKVNPAITRAFHPLLLATLLSAAANAQLNTCYQATMDKKTITYTGNVWREILNKIAERRVSADKDPLTPLDDNFKPNPKVKKCLGAVDLHLRDAPDLYTEDAKYYGTVSSAGTFRKLAELKCDQLGGMTNQFFMVGKIVLYRFCGGGEGNGYVFFWGWADKTDS